MSKKKKDKEEIRIPHFRAPADKLDLDVLNVGGILHSGRVVNSLRVDVSLESEITHDSDIVPDTPPRVDEWDPRVREFCQQLQSWKKDDSDKPHPGLSGWFVASVSPAGKLVSFKKTIEVRL